MLKVRTMKMKAKKPTKSERDIALLQVAVIDLKDRLRTERNARVELEGAWDSDRLRLIQQIREIREGLGGQTWTTQRGHKRWITLLSSPHLCNILRFIETKRMDGGRTVAAIKWELERRHSDQEFRGRVLAEKTVIGRLKRAFANFLTSMDVTHKGSDPLAGP